MEMQTPYKQVLKQLYQINWYNPVKMGLDNMHRLDDLLLNPLKSIPIVHVTGTNGKGSVSLKIAKALSASGIKTGLYTSPHISSFRERIEIDGELISEKEVESLLPPIINLCIQNGISATFFEITTALAFRKFQLSQCEAIVLEVGLGGRLDATNIVNPILSVITAVSFDHMNILGNTIEEIATEKAGIMKNGVDVLVAPGCPQEFMREKARAKNSPFHTLNTVLAPNQRLYNPDDPIFSDTDYLNTDIANAALQIVSRLSTPISSRLKLDSPDVKKSVFNRPICRFEEFEVIPSAPSTNNSKGKIKIILDMAHNIDAVKALVSRTHAHYPKSIIKVVMGMSSDKDIKACLPHFLELVHHRLDRIHCTAANSPRALATPELRKQLVEMEASLASALPNNASIEDTVKGLSHLDGEVRRVVRQAIDESLQEKGYPVSTSSEIPPIVKVLTNPVQDPEEHTVILICGTAFIMADARTEIGIDEPKDGDVLSDNNKSGYNLPKNFKDAQECFPEEKKSSK